jgi:hypothetical protein
MLLKRRSPATWHLGPLQIALAIFTYILEDPQLMFL